MKAVVYKGPRDVAVENIAEPRIEMTNDAIVRITSSGICGSDLHMYEGRTDIGPGLVFGHEPMGIVEDTGSGVQSIKKGDRVVVTFNVACGFCFNCIRGFTSACLTMNDQMAGAAFGYANMGPYKGGQAEFLRVPNADFNCVKLPGESGDEFEDDFVLLSDVFPTAYHATDLAGVMTGSTVAIFGDGPIGLGAAMCSLLRGAAEVYVVGQVPNRLAKAQKLGAIPIDANKGDPVDQIFEFRSSNKLITASMRPGEDKLMGVMCGIDAVGYQAYDWEHGDVEQPRRIMDDLIRVVNSTGQIGSIGFYPPYDPGGVDEDAKQGKLSMWFGKLWTKGITLGSGQAPIRKNAEMLKHVIISGRAKPSFIVSQRMSLEDAPKAYASFDKREKGFTKVILKPIKAYI